ncbi:MAG: antitoxin VapB family protein [Halobacteria archaeon]
MAKIVRLSDEAYERLSSLKKQEESLSDVVLRISTEPSLKKMADILPGDEANVLSAVVDERRKRIGKHLEEDVQGGDKIESN